ncbi:hypothetical protein JCM18899A_43690 [Nocardioides sp. AN3]
MSFVVGPETTQVSLDEQSQPVVVRDRCEKAPKVQVLEPVNEPVLGLLNRVEHLEALA